MTEEQKTTRLESLAAHIQAARKSLAQALHLDTVPSLPELALMVDALYISREQARAEAEKWAAASMDKDMELSLLKFEKSDKAP